MAIPQLKDKLNNAETKTPFHEFSFKKYSNLFCALDRFLVMASCLFLPHLSTLTARYSGRVSLRDYCFVTKIPFRSPVLSTEFRMPFIDRSFLMLSNLTWRRSSREKRWSGEKGKRKRLLWFFDLFDLPPLTPVWLMIPPSWETDTTSWKSYCCVINASTWVPIHFS